MGYKLHMYLPQINLPVSSCTARLSGQKHRFTPVCGLILAASATADAPHHLRISDVFGTNRTFYEGFLAYGLGMISRPSQTPRGPVETGERWKF